MRRTIAIAIVAVVGLGGFLVYNRGDDVAGARRPRRARRARPPMPVEFADRQAAPVSEQILVVGNLIGAATVEVVPRVNGRLQIGQRQARRLGARGPGRSRASRTAKSASRCGRRKPPTRSSQASIRQREADLKLAQNNLDRSRSLFERQLLPQQTFDDVDARHQAALAQLDLAQAQFEQAKARLDELKITLANTQIVSPVDGFIGKRYPRSGRVCQHQRAGRLGRRHPHGADGGQPRRARHAPRAGRARRPSSRSTRSPARTSRAASAASRRSSIRRRAPRRSRSKCRTPASGSSRGCIRACS